MVPPQSEGRCNIPFRKGLLPGTDGASWPGIMDNTTRRPTPEPSADAGRQTVAAGREMRGRLLGTLALTALALLGIVAAALTSCTLGSASLGYGIGNYFLYNGDRANALEVFRKIVAGNQWASFGYIAAESELK